MEEKFIAAWQANREKAAALGVRIRRVLDMKQAHQILSGHRESDGFSTLARLGKLELSMEALEEEKSDTEH